MCLENVSFQAIKSSYGLTFTGVKTHKTMKIYFKNYEFKILLD
jgi:hypothetical protein